MYLSRSSKLIRVRHEPALCMQDVHQHFGASDVNTNTHMYARRELRQTIRIGSHANKLTFISTRFVEIFKLFRIRMYVCRESVCGNRHKAEIVLLWHLTKTENLCTQFTKVELIRRNKEKDHHKRLIQRYHELDGLITVTAYQ